MPDEAADRPGAECLIGEWQSSHSPIAVLVPGTTDHRWRIDGARASLEGNAARRGCRIRMDAFDILITEATQLPPAFTTVRVSPDEVSRSGDAGADVAERWTSALDLPVVFGDITGSDGAAWRVEISAAPAAALRVAAGCKGAELHAPRTEATLLVLAAGTVSIEAFGAGLAAVGEGPARLMLLSSTDPADLARTLTLLRRKGFAGIQRQRAQHARVLHDYSVRLETPEPAIDLAFEWAKVGTGGARAFGPLPGIGRDVPAELRTLAACLPLEQPAEFLDLAGTGLFGVRVEEEAQALMLSVALPSTWERMALRRLRVAQVRVDCEVRRGRHGVIVGLTKTAGPPVAVAVALRGSGPAVVAVDGITLGGDTARFELGAEREVIFQSAVVS